MLDGRIVTIANADYRAWMLQDQAILSDIVGSLTPAVGGLVLFAASSMDAWTMLTHAFNA
jgi:hypothetical protein